MAYWLYCTDCQQWSKSATPLSDDKTCSFCNKNYGSSKIKLEKPIIPDSEEIATEVETIEMTEEPVETETPAIPEEEPPAVEETPEEADVSVIETAPESDPPDETAMTEAVPDLPQAKKTPSKKAVTAKKGRSAKR